MARETRSDPHRDHHQAPVLDDESWNLFLSQILDSAPLTRLVMESLPQWMVFLDRQLRVMWANQAAAQAVRQTPAQLEGRFCWQVWCEREDPCPDCALFTLEHGAPLPEIPFEAPGGKHYLASAAAVRDEGGDLGGYALIVRDVTDLKRAGEELKRREKLAGVLEMAGAAAHELSQPLQSLMGYCELLLTQAHCSPEQLQRLQPILEQVERLRKVVNKIQSITQYVSTPYLERSRIIDLDLASKPKNKS